MVGSRIGCSRNGRVRNGRSKIGCSRIGTSTERVCHQERGVVTIVRGIKSLTFLRYFSVKICKY